MAVCKDMATAKTASFWLTESMQLTAANTPVAGQIDLGAYVDVADRQGISVEQVDWIIQPIVAADQTVAPGLSTIGGDTGVSMQCTDQNRQGVLQRANDRAIVGSGTMYWDNGNSVVTQSSDIFPDNYGKLLEARTVVAPNLYFVAECDNLTANELLITCRLKCKVISIDSKSWMAIAIQSTAADN